MYKQRALIVYGIKIKHFRKAKTMKKLISMLLLSSLVLTFAACGDSETDDSKSTTTAAKTTAATTTKAPDNVGDDPTTDDGNTDDSKVTKGTLLSDEETADLVANGSKIAMDAGTMTIENTKNIFGDPATSGETDTKYSLFDDETDAESPTRFALDQDSAAAPVVLTWSIADTSAPVVPGYLTFTTGKNSTSWPQRRATEMVFYGSVDGEEWVELVVTTDLMEPIDSYTYAIKLDATVAFTQYKLEFQCASDGTNLAFQLNDLSVYAADAE